MLTKKVWRDTMILSYIRTIVLYLVLITVIRLMGKRQVGQMEPSEFVVTMLVANLASIPMQDEGVPLYSGLVPILTVLGVELLLSAFSVSSVGFRRLLCGKPVILIENGKVLQENLRKTRVTLDELTGHLREKDVLDISTVQYAILETSGNLSVFPYPKYQPANAMEAGVQAKKQYLPITIVGDGYLYRENLALAKKDENWLARVLKEKGAELKEVWLLTVDGADHMVFLRKEQQT
jgi:uncharacterized membrane protein YcaP (DUF421 family)